MAPAATSTAKPTGAWPRSRCDPEAPTSPRGIWPTPKHLANALGVQHILTSFLNPGVRVSSVPRELWHVWGQGHRPHPPCRTDHPGESFPPRDEHKTPRGHREARGGLGDSAPGLLSSMARAASLQVPAPVAPPQLPTQLQELCQPSARHRHPRGSRGQDRSSHLLPVGGSSLRGSSEIWALSSGCKNLHGAWARAQLYPGTAAHAGTDRAAHVAAQRRAGCWQLLLGIWGEHPPPDTPA